MSYFVFHKGFHALAVEYNSWSAQDFYTHFWQLDPQNVIFAAPEGNIDDYYYNVNVSLEILLRLLKFQFNDNDAECAAFVKILFAVCEKSIPKLNVVVLCGSACSGKTYFIDVVLHYYLNYGQLANFNKYCGFPLQDCPYKRILLWNEPRYLLYPQSTLAKDPHLRA